MSQVLHGCATTTEAVRRAIQNSQASLRALAKRYGINPKTVAKWKKREATTDLPTGPKQPQSTVLSAGEEATVVVQRALVGLQRHDGVAALGSDLLRNRALRVERINSDGAALQAERLQQFRHGGTLVRLRIGGDLPGHRLLLAGSRRDYVQHRLARGGVEGATQHLAVDGDDALAGFGEPRHEVLKEAQNPPGRATGTSC